MRATKASVSLNSNRGLQQVGHIAICATSDLREIDFGGDDSLLGKVFTKITEDSHLLVEDGNIDKYKKRPYRWISVVTSKNKILNDNMQTMLAIASSIFLSFDKTVIAPRLPNALFK
jgi:hypothetical protein